MKRRNFLRKSAAAGIATVAGVGIFNSIPAVKAQKDEKSAEELDEEEIKVNFHDTIDELYPVGNDYERFDQANTAFNVSFWGAMGVNTHPTDIKGVYGAIQKNLSGGKEYKQNLDAEDGYGRLDYAYKAGASATEALSGTIFERIFSGDSGPNIPRPDGSLMPLGFYKDSFPNGFTVADSKYQFPSLNATSYAIKKTAKKYGASLVGIAPYDERWTYKSEVYAPFDATKPGKKPAFFKDKLNMYRPVEFKFKPKSVIVLAFEMDYEAYQTSPSPLANAASNIGYSQMADVTLRISNFIRTLGYNTKHAGNSIGPSVPNAISAGLGELGRNGMLITAEYGPRVRLARVYTDMEFEYDKPKTFGVKAFCNVCKKCADLCPSKAITKADLPTDPENQACNRSNNVGVGNKFYLDGQKCLKFWAENEAGCSNCIASCPYNKIEGWHHDVAKMATKIPVVNRLTRYLDEAFGYGEVDSKSNMKNFWKKTI